MPEFFRKKDIILFVLFAATLHILLTHLVSSRVGSAADPQTAAVISGSLLNKEVQEKKIQDVPSQPEKQSKVYRSILFFLALPFDPVFQPVHQRWAVRPFQEGEIQVNEYEFRAGLIGTATRVLNSIVFSLLVYWIFRTVIQRMKQNKMHEKT